MLEMILQEVAGWICGLAREFGQEGKHHDVELEGILKFLTMHIGGKKFKSLSYIELLRNFYLNGNGKHLNHSFVLHQGTYQPVKMEMASQISRSEIPSKPSISPEQLLSTSPTTTTEVESIEMDDSRLIEKSTNQAAEMPGSQLKGVKNSGPIFRSKYFVKPMASEEDETSDAGWSDEEEEEELEADGIGTGSFRCEFSESDSDEDDDDDRDSDDLDGGRNGHSSESDDDDILFCDGIKPDVPASSEHKCRRVRFRSQTGIFDVDSRWSDDDLMEARRGPWEEFARDGERFRQRIRDTERKISWIFDVKHQQRASQDQIID